MGALREKTFDEAASAFLSLVTESGKNIIAVGHRVVHGGEKFIHPVLLTPRVIRSLRSISFLAPLHNPLNLQGIEWAQKILPNVPHVAVFDTAFHHTLAEEHYVYPLPLSWKNLGVRRYGFHGISHQASYEHWNEIRGGKGKEDLLVTCHLGNGCSLAAIKEGLSIDTTMGMTPLEGLVMGTRSGSIDPGILFYMAQEKGYTSSELDDILNRESGLKALAGTNDMREILKKKNQGKRAAFLAFEIYCFSCAKGVSAMSVSLGGLSALIFTGGIGERGTEVRQRICELLSFLGVRLSLKKNQSLLSEGKISLSSSKAAVYVLKAREEWQIAKETLNLLKI